MKTIWKKLSAGLLAFALVFTTIPPIGASADTIDPGTDTGEKEECVIDVSTAEHFSLPMQGVDYVYVLTGENTSADIYINGDCDIVLNNAAVRRIYTNDQESYTVNITLKGENTIDQNYSNSRGALDVFRSDVTINGDEDDSLIAKSRVFCCYSSNGDAGGITVDGGKITFEGESSSALATTYTQNGGTVKTITAGGSSFRYALNLNGGILEVDHKAANSSIFDEPVKIKNGASMKVTGPETPGQSFSFNGPIGLVDDAAADDCLFVKFDETSAFVYLDEENEILRDKTYAEIKAVTHVHEYENGICSCGFACNHDTDDGTCSLCEAYIYKIKHQPTEGEPYVALNDGTGASYQWYEVKNISEITGESKIYPWSYFGAPFEENSTYDAKAGWTPIQVYEDDVYKALYYIIAPFAADDKVTLRFSSPVEDAVLFTPNEASAECELDGTVATATIPSDGVYGIYAMTKSTEPTVKVYVGDAEVNALTGQTSATLSQYAYGNYYYCKATAKDGTVLTSDYADFTYKITHQPTDEAQYVSLNDSTGASYQWYEEKGGIVSVTDENAISFTVLGAPSEIGGTYDSETGWTPDAEGHYFALWLNEGDIVNFEFSLAPSEWGYLFSTTEGTVEGEANIESDTSLTAPASGYYGIWAEDGGNLKATMDGTEFIAVSGQTDATLNASELGRYRCEVTFGNGTKKTSDIVEVQHLHAGGTATCKDKAVCATCGIGYGPLSTMHDYSAATCTTPKTCKVCKKTTGDPLGHSYSSSYTVDKKATTSADGSKSKHCTRSGCSAKKSVTAIPKIKSAKLSYTKTTYSGNAKKPSVTVKDSKGDTLVKDTDYEVTYASGRTKVGRYKVTVTFIGEYSGSEELYFTIALSAPANVKIAPVTSTGKPKVTWDKVEGASKYEVWRKVGSDGTYARQYTTTGTSYTNTSAKPGTVYYYKVKAIHQDNAVCNSAFSAAKSIACDLAKPTGLKVTTVASSGKPKVTWNKVDGATKYEVWRKVGSSGTYARQYTTTDTSYTNTSATAGKVYYYKVKAICGKNSGGNSAFSASDYVTCDLAAPKITVSGTKKPGKIVVSWSKVTGADRYYIYRATSKNGTYSKYSSTTSTTWTNTSVTEGKYYYYKVKAVYDGKSAANSAYSNMDYAWVR